MANVDITLMNYMDYLKNTQKLTKEDFLYHLKKKATSYNIGLPKAYENAYKTMAEKDSFLQGYQQNLGTHTMPNERDAEFHRLSVDEQRKRQEIQEMLNNEKSQIENMFRAARYNGYEVFGITAEELDDIQFTPNLSPDTTLDIKNKVINEY